MPIELHHQTGAEFAVRLRERWSRSDKADCARIAWWLIERINAGDLTDQQLRNAFGVTQQQWSNFKTSTLEPLHSAWALIRETVGN